MPGKAGDLGLIPVLGRSPGEGNGHLLQDSCLGKSHGQKSLADYSPWSRKRVGHNLMTKPQPTPARESFLPGHPDCLPLPVTEKTVSLIS